MRSSGRRARTMIHVPFAAPSKIFDALRSLPWTAIGFDLVEGPGSWELLRDVPKERTVGLGLIDARNTRLEEPAAVARAVAGGRGR